MEISIGHKASNNVEQREKNDMNKLNFFSTNFCLKSGSSKDFTKQTACFSFFDLDNDGKLNREEFHNMMIQLTSTDESSSNRNIEEKIFHILDEDKDDMLNEEEFSMAWRYWLSQVLDPVCTLLVIDVQNDFVNGSLSLTNCPAKHNGAEIVPVINELIHSVPFDIVAYSKDWHPADHISFIDNIRHRPLHPTCKFDADTACVFDEVLFNDNQSQILWPRHCVQESTGAELYPTLAVRHDAIIVNKGTNSDVDSYSAFWDNGKLAQTELSAILSKNRVTDVYICGLAYDVCVAYTANDAMEHGFRTIIIDDACRGVDENQINNVKENLLHKGGIIVHSSEVSNLVNAKVRPIELVYQAALNFDAAKRIITNNYVSNSCRL